MKLTTMTRVTIDGVMQEIGGRRTYEPFAGYWGVRDDRENPIVGALNTKPKYVASTTLTDPTWSDTTVLSGDLATAVRELKAEPGGELQVHGSGTLTPVAAGERPRRRDDSAHHPGGRRPGRAAVPSQRPGPCPRPGRVASGLKGVTIQVLRPAARSMRRREARRLDHRR